MLGTSLCTISDGPSRNFLRHKMPKIAISSVQERNRADPGHTTETGIIHSHDSL